MEQLFSDNKLGELEEKIDVLLSAYKDMREEKESTVSRIESLEAENRELKELVAKVEGEKDLVMQKVKGILEKIQKIEA
jgi:regulator of replication initiation timing